MWLLFTGTWINFYVTPSCPWDKWWLLSWKTRRKAELSSSTSLVLGKLASACDYSGGLVQLIIKREQIDAVLKSVLGRKQLQTERNHHQCNLFPWSQMHLAVSPILPAVYQCSRPLSVRCFYCHFSSFPPIAMFDNYTERKVTFAHQLQCMLCRRNRSDCAWWNAQKKKFLTCTRK